MRRRGRAIGGKAGKLIYSEGKDVESGVGSRDGVARRVRGDGGVGQAGS